MLSFFEAHVALWANDPTGIGLTAEQVTALSGQTVASRSAHTVAVAARETSKGATTALQNELTQLRDMGGPMINAIRAFAEGSDDPGAVYAAAQIPPPAAPSPAPAPDAPTNITTTVYTTGAVELKWKVKQPRRGAEIFTVIFRQLNKTGPYTEYASTGEKTFVDTNIPPGATAVSYVLRARRGDQVSVPSDTVVQHLGVPGNGEQQGLSLAA